GNSELAGKVIRLMPYGAFVKLDEGKVGLIYVGELTRALGEDYQKIIREGDRVLVKISGRGKDNKLNLSFVKKMRDEPAPKQFEEVKKSAFEYKLKKFLKESQDSLSDQNNRIKRHRGMAA
ncbi:MAG: S1 RNA-binding domain-containing protein, partial [Caldisericum sp.]|uniref:S1 RNA-binding domain-containing protein n=1 Tax=Caldisericum sp. TaxID=2499687 RepID=UPI003D108514